MHGDVHVDILTAPGRVLQLATVVATEHAGAAYAPAPMMRPAALPYAMQLLCNMASDLQ